MAICLRAYFPLFRPRSEMSGFRSGGYQTRSKVKSHKIQEPVPKTISFEKPKPVSVAPALTPTLPPVPIERKGVLLDKPIPFKAIHGGFESHSYQEMLTNSRACSIRNGYDTVKRYKFSLSSNPGSFEKMLEAIGEQNKISYEGHYQKCMCASDEKKRLEDEKEREDALQCHMKYLMNEINNKRLTSEDAKLQLGWTNYWRFVTFCSASGNPMTD